MAKEWAGESGALDQKDHLLLDMVDLLNGIRYFVSTNTAVAVGRKNVSKVFKGAPPRIPRPGDPKPEIRYGTKDDISKTGVGFKMKGG